MDSGAGVVVAVGLWRGAADRRVEDGVAARGSRRPRWLWGWIPVHVGRRRRVAPVGGDWAGPGAATVRWRPDVCALTGMEREDGDGRSRVWDRGPQPDDRRGLAWVRGLTIATCRPAIPQSKGGLGRATVKIAKADLVPTDHNLRDAVSGLRAVGGGVRAVHGRGPDARPHRVTRRPPLEMLGAEHEHLHRLPRLPAHDLFRADAQGQLAVDDLRRRLDPTRSRTSWSTSGCGSGIDGSELIVVHVDGPFSSGRSRAISFGRAPGGPALCDGHYPPSRPARWTASPGRAASRSARSSRSGRTPSGG